MSNETLDKLPHKLATLIQCLPQAPFRDHLAAECIKQAERIAELEARVHTCGPTCSKAGCINSRVTAERDQLRAEVERLRVDAERYRWLKAYDQNSEDMGICKWVDEGWSGQWVIEHDPDAAIDHARTTRKDEG